MAERVVLCNNDDHAYSVEGFDSYFKLYFYLANFSDAPLRQITIKIGNYVLHTLITCG